MKDCAAAGEAAVRPAAKAGAARHGLSPQSKILAALVFRIRPAASGPASARTNQLELTCSAEGGEGEARLEVDEETKC